MEEARALEEGMVLAKELGLANLDIRMDAQLLVSRLNGSFVIDPLLPSLTTAGTCFWCLKKAIVSHIG